MSKPFRIYFWSTLTLAVVAFAWLSCLPAHAAMLCGPCKQVIEGLKTQYSEKEIWFGTPLSSKDSILLLLASDKGTWTLLLVKPDVACVLSGGTGSGGDPV